MRPDRKRSLAALALVCGLCGVALLPLGCGKPEQAGSPAGPGPSAPPNLVKNGDFAKLDAVDRDLPVEWLRSQATRATVAAVKGDNGNILRIRAHPEGKLWQSLTQTLPALQAGKEYRVSFEGRATTKDGGRVTVLGFVDEKTTKGLTAYRFANSDWQQHEFSFVMPQESMSRVDLVLGQGNYKNRELVVEYKNVAVYDLE